MKVNLKGRSFLKLLDFSSREIEHLLHLSAQFKRLKQSGTRHEYLKGKNIVLLFEKSSTRTRCAFEVGAEDLGMGHTYLEPGASQMGAKESLEDTARVLGRMYDGIEYRGFDQVKVERLAKAAGVPVWNGLTTQSHPTQALADILTIREVFGSSEGLSVSMIGNAAGNTGNSLMVMCAKLGINFTACGPDQRMPDANLVEICRDIARLHGSCITLTNDVNRGFRDANVIYTDVWVGLGQPEKLWAQRISLLEPYRVTADLMAKASPSALFMHCLPAFHDTKTTIGKDIAKRYGITEMEVQNAVFEGRCSRVFDQAENRMHTIKAVLFATLA